MPRLLPLALGLLITACSTDRLTGVAAENAARQYQSQARAESDEPLFFIDGKEVTSTFARAMNPTSIESIEVLKGDAAVVLYGSRGSRGVILIRTKPAADGTDR